MPPQPTAAERAESRKQDASLRSAKVTPKEGRVIASANRSEGMTKKAKGGITKKMPTSKEMGNMGMTKGGMAAKFGNAMKKKSADTKGRAMVKKAGGGKCYAGGGLVSGHKTADGIATKGKTKGKMC